MPAAKRVPGLTGLRSWVTPVAKVMALMVPLRVERVVSGGQGTWVATAGRGVAVGVAGGAAGCLVGVAVGVRVCVTVAVLVRVGVGVGVRVAVAVRVAVGVGVRVGTGAAVGGYAALEAGSLQRPRDRTPTGSLK